MNDRGPYTVQMHQQDQGNGVISVREEFGDSAIAPRAVEESAIARFQEPLDPTENRSLLDAERARLVPGYVRQSEELVTQVRDEDRPSFTGRLAEAESQDG